MWVTKVTHMIQDLQRLNKRTIEWMTFIFFQLQGINAKMYAKIQQTNLSVDQIKAQCTLIDIMSSNTLFTVL